MAVHRLRRRFAAVLREEVARTVADPADVDAEIRWMLETLRSGGEAAEAPMTVGRLAACPQCGAVLAGAAAVEDLCSACLLSLALSQDAIPTEVASDPRARRRGRGPRPGTRRRAR